MKYRRHMRIGPFDKRRIVRRCEQCRISRTKCDGGRPCNACRARSTRCQDQIPEQAARLEIISPEFPVSSVGPAESQLRSTTACLQYAHRFIGTCPSPITDLFSTSMFLRLFREDTSIRAAFIHIGNAYATNGQHTVESGDGNMFTEIDQRELYTTIQTRLQMWESHLDPSLLLLILLFCILQLMTSQNSNIGLQIVDQATFHLVHRRGPYGFVTEFDKSTLLLFRILQGLGRLMRDQDTTFADTIWCKTINDVEATRFPTSKEQDTAFFDCICTFIALLGEINVKSRTWATQERKFARMPDIRHATIDCTCPVCAEASAYAKHLAIGQSILQEASELLKAIERFEDVVRGAKAAYDTSYDMLFAHSLCLKIGTLRLFADLIWQNAPFSRVALQESNIFDYAFSALNHVENRLQNSGLESVIYIQHLMVIGIEVGDLASRQRVISLLRKIRNRGFIIAEVYIADLELAWKAVPAIENGHI